ncbi:MAG: tetratricopeptide repeat protein [Cyanobacteria bacterium P01_D01_bin.56]
MDNCTTQVTTLRDIALAYYQLNHRDQAHAVLQQALTVANSITGRWARIIIFSNLAAVYSQWQDHGQALNILEQALGTVGAYPANDQSFLEFGDTSEQLVEALSTLATQVGHLEPGERSTALLKAILQEIESIAPDRTVPLLYGAIAALQLGHIHWHQQIVDQALSDFDPDRGWLVVSVVEDFIQTAATLQNPEHSFAALASAQKIVSSLEDDWYQLLAWQDIAKVYGTLGYRDRTHTMLNRCLELIHSLSVTHQQKIRALSELAITYSLFAPTQSRDLLQQALTLSTKHDHQDSVAFGTIVEAAAHLDNAAQRYILQQVLGAAETIACDLSKAAALSALADGYNNLGESTTAKSLLEQALDLAAPYYVFQRPSASAAVPEPAAVASHPQALAYIVDNSGDLQPINQVQTVFGLLLEAAEQIRYPKIKEELHQWAAIAMADWRQSPKHS